MGRTSSVMKMLHRSNMKKKRLKLKEAVIEGKKKKRTGGRTKPADKKKAEAADSGK